MAADMENVFENFVIAVVKLYRSMRKIKDFEMREYGLKSVHVMCIYYLNESAEGLTLGELMRLTFEDKAAISRAVSQLREKGCVEYNSDKYNSPVRLTANGLKIAESILKKAECAVSAGSTGLTEEARVQFFKSLNEISDKLNNYYNNLTEGKEA